MDSATAGRMPIGPGRRTLPAMRSTVRAALTMGCAATAVLVCRAQAESTRCALFQSDSAAAPAASCLSCHANTGPGNHPVDIDYAAAARAGSSLRTPEEVVRRGVPLTDGQVRCTTCHDARSPWKYRIALPPGATARPAVNPRDPTTYDPVLRRVHTAAPQPGDEVSAKPLCLACHAMD